MFGSRRLKPWSPDQQAGMAAIALGLPVVSTEAWSRDQHMEQVRGTAATLVLMDGILRDLQSSRSIK
jgi:hypothetical protein